MSNEFTINDFLAILYLVHILWSMHINGDIYLEALEIYLCRKYNIVNTLLLFIYHNSLSLCLMALKQRFCQ